MHPTPYTYTEVLVAVGELPAVAFDGEVEVAFETIAILVLEAATTSAAATATTALTVACVSSVYSPPAVVADVVVVPLRPLQQRPSAVAVEAPYIELAAVVERRQPRRPAAERRRAAAIYWDLRNVANNWIVLCVASAR